MHVQFLCVWLCCIFACAPVQKKLIKNAGRLTHAHTYTSATTLRSYRHHTSQSQVIIISKKKRVLAFLQGLRRKKERRLMSTSTG